MRTIEILEAYKISWNAINKANNHGNITIQRSHTQMLALTAQTIEQLALRLMELEPVDEPTEESLKRGEELNDARLLEVLDAVKNNEPIPSLQESTAQRIVRESIGKR